MCDLQTSFQLKYVVIRRHSFCPHAERMFTNHTGNNDEQGIFVTLLKTEHCSRR
jgi:hypothetical protein